MATISQGFGDVRGRMPWWILGALIERSSNDEIRTALNAYPQGVQVGTTVVGGATNDKDYVVTINGVDVTYTSDGTATVAEIADGLADAINAEPLVRGQVTAVSDGVDTVTLTGNTPGAAFTASDADAQLTTTEAVTAADEADPIEFGRAVVRTGYQDADELVAKAASTLFDAQVITLTPTFVSGAILTVAVFEIRNGERHLLKSVSETSATNLDTTITALVATLNAQLPANSVLAAEDGSVITLTAEVAGLEIDVDVSVDDSGASVPTWTVAYTTGPSEATSFHRAFRGVALRDQAVGAETIGGNEQQCPANGALAYARKGLVAVESAEAITAGSDVFVELGVSADNGKFFAADSATRIGLARNLARWERDADTNTGSLAALRLMGA